MAEYSGTCFKKGRGMAQRSLDLIEAMCTMAKAAQPITGRGVGYKLFVAGLIPSMATPEMQRVYRLLKEAREQGISRGSGSLMRPATMSGSQPGAIPPNMPAVSRDPIAATSGISSPIRFRSGQREGHRARPAQPGAGSITPSASFRCMGSAAPPLSMTLPRMTMVADLIIFYVGDYDPSGMHMSEEDLPDAVRQYDGDHIKLRRIALTREQTSGLLSFPATDKARTPATNGSSPITETVAGNSMRWTPTICATASKRQSRN